MVSISRILCPVDFSQYSHRALDYAVAMAKWYESSVTALHVFPMAPVVDMMPSIGVGGLPPLEFTEEDREALRNRLRQFSMAATESCVELVVEQAPDIRTEILDQADARKADLIVVGSHGRSGFQHLLLGSTTERILRKARVPVLVVPRKQGDDSAVPSMPFKRIVCPVDFRTPHSTRSRPRSASPRRRTRRSCSCTCWRCRPSCTRCRRCSRAR